MSITSANTVLTLSQTTLFPTPVRIQGFAADDVYDLDQVQLVEESMGVDGVLSFGFVFTARRQTISLQADSASNSFFDTIMLQQQAALDVYPLTGQILLPGISTKFNMINGALRDYNPGPSAKKTLQRRSFIVVWNTILPAPSS